MKRSIAVCLGLLALASPAAAESPVAVVEDVKGKVTGAEFMDYVTPKAVIKIGDGGSVILSYLKSCRRETISGAGTVVRGRLRQGEQERRARRFCRAGGGRALHRPELPPADADRVRVSAA